MNNSTTTYDTMTYDTTTSATQGAMTALDPSHKPPLSSLCWLEKRGISPETMSEFGIQDFEYGFRSGCAFPTYHSDGSLGRRRFKAAPNPNHANSATKSTNKYCWLEQDAQIPCGYNLNRIRQWLETGHTELYWVGGEVDVWSMHQAGLPAVSTFGDTVGVEALVAALQERGVTHLEVILDNDDSGRQGACMIAGAAKKYGLICTIRILSGSDKSDINDLYQSVSGDQSRFMKAIAELPVADEATLNGWAKTSLPKDNLLQSNSRQDDPLQSDSLQSGVVQQDSFEDRVVEEASSSMTIQPVVPKPLTAYLKPVEKPLGWPERMRPEGFHGLVGDYTLAYEAFTEADVHAILISLLQGFSSIVGRKPHITIEQTRHPLNLFVAIVGTTSAGRKGTAWGNAKEMLTHVDPHWAKTCLPSGLSSGEGLIESLQCREKDSEEGVDPDSGVRALFIESEFARTLIAANRNGSTLSPIIRQAWDGVPLEVSTRKNPLRMDKGHVCIQGHITPEELLKTLNGTETINGFANRFLWLASHRSQEIPNKKCIPEPEWEHHDNAVKDLRERFREAASFARQIGEMDFGPEATQVWCDNYGRLELERPGIIGGVTGRVLPQVTRLACLYALLDQTAIVGQAHVQAALALWDYCDASTGYIFCDGTNKKLMGKIEAFLAGAPGGVTESGITAHLNNNVSADLKNRALEALEKAGIARKKVESGSGRKTVTRWYHKDHAPKTGEAFDERSGGEK